MVISIHIFLAEGDLSELVCESLINIFQSTPSSQKVTTKSAKHRIDDLISIHTFLAEGDVRSPYNVISGNRFQSTPSSQKATNL